MPAIDPKNDEYNEFNVTWRDICLTIRHCANWCAVVGMDHIEVMSDGRVVLPITQTGYRSHFIPLERIAEIGTPTEYVIAWLDHEAQAESWKCYEQHARQLSLF